MGFNRSKVLFVGCCGPGTLGHTQHHGDAGAVDIRIQQTNLSTSPLQSQRQINGGGRFAHSALARGHCHYVFHLI